MASRWTRPRTLLAPPRSKARSDQLGHLLGGRTRRGVNGIWQIGVPQLSRMKTRAADQMCRATTTLLILAAGGSTLAVLLTTEAARRGAVRSCPQRRWGCTQRGACGARECRDSRERRSVRLKDVRGGRIRGGSLRSASTYLARHQGACAARRSPHGRVPRQRKSRRSPKRLATLTARSASAGSSATL